LKDIFTDCKDNYSSGAETEIDIVMIRELKPFLTGRNMPFAPEHIEMYLNVDLKLINTFI
jgi:hypothetical protein